LEPGVCPERLEPRLQTGEPDVEGGLSRLNQVVEPYAQLRHSDLSRGSGVLALALIETGPARDVADTLLQRLELNQEFPPLRLKRAVGFFTHPPDGSLDSAIDLASIESGPDRERVDRPLFRHGDHPFDALERPRRLFRLLGSHLRRCLEMTWPIAPLTASESGSWFASASLIRRSTAAHQASHVIAFRRLRSAASRFSSSSIRRSRESSVRAKARRQAAAGSLRSPDRF
jgi:hypothetical protein